MDRSNHTRSAVIICLLLVLTTLAAYWPVFQNQFVKLDDARYITENQHVLPGLKWENVKWAFTAGYAGNWHPLTWISHMVDVQLFGVQPRWHHLVNVLFHLANTLLLFLTLRRMTGALWRSALVAALFALHPLHVESVAWAAERKDVLSTFFFLLTLLAYANYVAQKPKVAAAPGKSKKVTHGPLPTFRLLLWYALSLLLFALGLLSKPMLVTLPCVLFLLDYWPLRRFEIGQWRIQRIILEKIPFFALSAASCVITFIVQDQGHAVSSAEGLPLEPRVATSLVAYVKYLGKMVWPVKLAVFYPHPGVRGPENMYPGWEVLGAALLLALVTAWALLRLKSRPSFAVGWFWYLGTLVPVIGLLQVGGQEMADRYSYIPLIGIFVALAWAMPRFRLGKAERMAADTGLPRLAWLGFGGLGFAVLTACGLLTHRQVQYWKDNYTLFKHALAVTKDNAPALYNVAIGLEQEGKMQQAEEKFRAATVADPSFSDAYYSLGSILASRDDVDGAIAQYETALRFHPWNGLAYNGLGAMYWRQGKTNEAEAEYRQALHFEPFLREAHFNLATALLARGDLSGAEQHYEQAARIKPGDPETLRRLATALVRQSKFADAEAPLRQLVTLFTTNAGVHFDLGDVLRLEGKTGAAATEFGEALRLQPRFTEAETGLARILAAQGKLAEAETHFREAARLCPTNAEAEFALGNVLMVTGKTNEAAACFAKARQLDPQLAARNLEQGKALALKGEVQAAQLCFAAAVALEPENAEAHEQFGVLLRDLGRLPDSVLHLEAALRLASGRSGLPVADWYYNLSLALELQGNMALAATNLQQALELNPDSLPALNDLAWLRATASQPQLRNGAEAVRLAERACQLSGGNQARFWGTLDAAYAETGNFDKAIATAQKARSLALAAGEQALATAAEQRLELYRKQQPIRQ